MTIFDDLNEEVYTILDSDEELKGPFYLIKRKDTHFYFGSLLTLNNKIEHDIAIRIDGNIVVKKIINNKLITKLKLKGLV